MVHRQSSEHSWRSPSNAKHNKYTKSSWINFDHWRHRWIQSATSIAHVICFPTARAVNNALIVVRSLSLDFKVFSSLSFCINITYLLHNHTKSVCYILLNLHSIICTTIIGQRQVILTMYFSTSSGPQDSSPLSPSQWPDFAIAPSFSPSPLLVSCLITHTHLNFVFQWI